MLDTTEEQYTLSYNSENRRTTHSHMLSNPSLKKLFKSYFYKTATLEKLLNTNYVLELPDILTGDQKQEILSEFKNAKDNFIRKILNLKKTDPIREGEALEEAFGQVFKEYQAFEIDKLKDFVKESQKKRLFFGGLSTVSTLGILGIGIAGITTSLFLSMGSVLLIAAIVLMLIAVASYREYRHLCVSDQADLRDIKKLEGLSLPKIAKMPNTMAKSLPNPNETSVHSRINSEAQRPIIGVQEKRSSPKNT